MVCWTGKIKPGQWNIEILHHTNWMPTFLALAAEPDVKDMLPKGHTAAGRHFKVQMFGYSILPMLTGESEESLRTEVFYFSKDGDLTALCYDDVKLIFMEQKVEGTFRVWMGLFMLLRLPLIENLRRDPGERDAITSITTMTGCSIAPSCRCRHRLTSVELQTVPASSGGSKF